MNEAVTKQRPSTDFEEFERFMRESAQPQHQAPRPGEGDPLSELARLVGNHPDPYRDVFAHDDRHEGAPMERQEPSLARPTIDFAAIEAGLRGTIPAHEAYPAPVEPSFAPARFEEQPAPPRAFSARSRRPIYAMTAVIVAGVVGIGVAFAYKGSNSGPREIAMIKAAPGPMKVQPPVDDTHDQPSRDASILDKAQQPAPTRTVSREEQPIDLAQAVQPRDVGNGITPLYNFGYSGAGAGADAASVPVPAPPGQADDQKPVDAIAAAADIKPIRVKTRSYRPDGTPIPNDQPPVAAADPAPAVAPKATVAKASSPKIVAPKSTTRVAAATKPIVTADLGQDAPTELSPAAPPRKVVKAKPVKTATVVDPATDQDAAQAPAAATSGSGAYAVQLAAPGTEADAKQVSSRLQQKYSGELSGHDLSFQKAMSKGKQVYRVRVSGLSRDEANGMCDKLKSSGGSCFVAKN